LSNLLTITKEIDGKIILDNITFELFENEVIVLLGENGSGKTTLMKIISGLLAADNETVQHNLYAEYVYVGDNPVLYEELTGMEHLNFCSSLFNCEGKMEETLALAADLHLTEHLHNRVINYSLGMKKKLQLLCVFMKEPKVLLLDEYISGLDANSLTLLKRILREYVKKKSNSIVFCSHILDFSEELGDKFFLLNKGKLISRINKQQLVDEYGSLKSYYASLG
jgi:ABC-2 type transport system ATP-binding protein